MNLIIKHITIIRKKLFVWCKKINKLRHIENTLFCERSRSRGWSWSLTFSLILVLVREQSPGAGWVSTFEQMNQQEDMENKHGDLTAPEDVEKKRQVLTADELRAQMCSYCHPWNVEHMFILHYLRGRVDHNEKTASTETWSQHSRCICSETGNVQRKSQTTAIFGVFSRGIHDHRHYLIEKQKRSCHRLIRSKIQSPFR